MFMNVAKMRLAAPREQAVRWQDRLLGEVGEIRSDQDRAEPRDVMRGGLDPFGDAEDRTAGGPQYRGGRDRRPVAEAMLRDSNHQCVNAHLRRVGGQLVARVTNDDPEPERRKMRSGERLR